MRRLRLAAISSFLLYLLGMVGCQEETPSVAFVVYDAGETLGLLPVAARLRADRIDVGWFPLTPWAADLLEANGESFLSLPHGISEMPHVEGRELESEVGYWEEALIREHPSLVVSGMVSAVQSQIAIGLRGAGVATRGFYDGFQPPGPGSIGAKTAPAFDDIWVPTERVKEGFGALGFDVVVAGQPTLDAWRRVSREIDAQEVRRRQGAGEGDRILTFAGQYGPGYEAILNSLLESIRETLAADPTLLLVLSHHPRTQGSVERAALERAGIPRAVMAVEGVPTAELATVSEVVITWTSTVGVQAAFMGKPVLYFSPPEDFDTHLVDGGAATLAHASDLGEVLSGILSESPAPEAVRRTLMDAGYVIDADQVVTEMILAAMGR